MIRKASIADLDIITDLELKTLGETLGSQMLKSMIENPLINIYVYDEDIIKGYISFLFDGQAVEIYNLAVYEEFQGRKIGTKLIEFIIELFNNQNINYLLEVRCSNQKAISLYKKFNFKEIRVRKNYYGNEDALVLMRSKGENNEK